LPVTWPAQGATTLAGSGTAYVWRLEKYAAVAGNGLSGAAQTCKLALPDVMLGSTIALILGGSKVQIQIAPAVWAKVPANPLAATQTGWGPPSTFTTNAPIDLVGLALPTGSDPALAWPSAPSGFPMGTTFSDDDADGNPGVTGTPLSTAGYVLPPVDGLATARADQVYIVSRNQFALAATWTSCTDQTGMATARFFDNHVVGCHVSGGSACTSGSTNSQAGFLDSNRTVYAPQSGATFVAKILPSAAVCADALTALP
jgi:hypothetical protein